MTNREQVMYAIERCTSHEPDVCGQCPYFGDGDAIRCMEVLMKKALKLLKDQSDIIRCKYCKHYKDETGICDLYHVHGYAETWFCADGKRRETND